MATDSFAVRNRTREGTVAQGAENAAGLVARTRGLMFRSDWTGSDGLLLAPCNSVHTFFMRMPIDLLFLDAESRVLRATRALAPWRIGPIVRQAKRVVELP